MARLFEVITLVFAMHAAALFGAPATSDTQTDDLTSRDWSDKKRNTYLRLLEETLGHVPYDCGRVIDSSSFGPEGILSIFSRAQNGKRTYHVVAAEPSRNLWEATNAMTAVESARTISVRKTEVQIPRTTAENIRSVWSTALRDVHAPSLLKSGFVIAGYLEFAIQDQTHRPIYAELWLPPSGPKTRSLQGMYEQLWAYCKAKPKERATILKKIDKQLAQYLSKSIRKR